MATQTTEAALTPLGAFSLLDGDALRYLLAHFLDGAAIARLAMCSSAFRAAAGDAHVWAALCAREYADLAALLPAALPPRECYARLHALSTLSRLACAEAEAEDAPAHQARLPTPREGSACVALDDTHLVVLGGWTVLGMSADVTFLRLAADPTEAAFSARQVVPTGAPRMCSRYGHSATLVPAGVVCIGGMTGGGYRGELNDAWLLRPSNGGDWHGALEWHEPEPLRRGDAVLPRARGYHSAVASPCGRRVYVFGGISDGDACDELAVLDTEMWTWAPPRGPADAHEPGAWPCARFGHSATIFEGSMWVLGGGTGGDLLRSGDELHDVWRLDLAALTWQRITAANPPPYPANLGRCHNAVAVGAKLLLFGGSAHTCNRLSTFDMRTRTFAAPLLAGAPPCSRFTALAARLGTRIVLTCGWSFGGERTRRGCLGDVWRIELAPEPADRLNAVQQLPPQAAGGGMHDGDADWRADEEDEDEEVGDDDDEAADDDDELLQPYLAEAFALEQLAGGAAGLDEGDAARTLVRALVLAMEAGDGAAVRRLLRRMRAHRAAEQSDGDGDEEEDGDEGFEEEE